MAVTARALSTVWRWLRVKDDFTLLSEDLRATYCYPRTLVNAKRALHWSRAQSQQRCHVWLFNLRVLKFPATNGTKNRIQPITSRLFRVKQGTKYIELGAPLVTRSSAFISDLRDLTWCHLHLLNKYSYILCIVGLTAYPPHTWHTFNPW